MITLTSIKRKSKNTVFGINVKGVSLELKVPNIVVDTVTKESKEAASTIKDSLSELFKTAVSTYNQHQQKTQDTKQNETSH